jgi:sarcosine oxidase, subunit beta
MKWRADAVVVGAGVVGASVAHFLARLGYGRVVLLEKSTIGNGSTRYSAAHVRQHYSNEIAIRLARRSVELFSRSEELLGGPTGFSEEGYLVLASPEESQAIRTVVALQRSHGVDAEILEPDAISAIYPELDLDGVGLGCLEREAGYADPVQTVRTLVATGERHGLVVREHCPVTDVELAGNKVTGVVTPEGSIATTVVVNACGPWGDRLSNRVGLDYNLRLSREHEVVFEAPADFGELPVVSDSAQRLYFRRYRDGGVLVGEGWPKRVEPADPETYDDGTDDHVARRMAAKLVQRVPALGSSIHMNGSLGGYVKGYSGVYDITEDWYPIIGAEPSVQGWYSAYGGSGHCFKLGPAIGEALADVIAGREPEIDIDPLSGTRFAEGRLFGSAWGPGNRA